MFLSKYITRESRDTLSDLEELKKLVKEYEDMKNRIEEIRSSLRKKVPEKLQGVLIKFTEGSTTVYARVKRVDYASLVRLNFTTDQYVIVSGRTVRVCGGFSECSYSDLSYENIEVVDVSEILSVIQEHTKKLLG